MIIDFHIHLFAPEVINNRFEYKNDKHFALLYQNNSSIIINHSGPLEMIKNKTLDKVVAMGFPWFSQDYAGQQNKYFAQLQKQHKDVIYCFGSIPLDPATNIEEWAGEIKKSGLSGIGEIAFYSNGFDQAAYGYLEKVFSSARNHQLPVCLHLNEPIGHSYPGKYEPGLNRLCVLLSEYKDLTIILSHWGGGLLFYELMPEIARDFSRFYYDTAASPYLYDDKIYSIAEQIIGTERILLGTDLPLLGLNRYKEAITSHLSSESAKKILGLNAAKLLGTL